MTVKDVKRKLDNIFEATADVERAHAFEDDLYLEVLTAIATGDCRCPAALAREAIKSKEIRFERYCA